MDFVTSLSMNSFNKLLSNCEDWSDPEKTPGHGRDFYEFVKGLDLVERGTFTEKCRYCFTLYDIMEQNYLDLFSLRQVLKRSYTSHILNLEEAMKEIKGAVVRESEILRHHNFSDPVNKFNQQLGLTHEADIRIYDGYINWAMLVQNSKSINLLKQSLSLALDRMEIQKTLI